jgi:hypothetical protein
MIASAPKTLETTLSPSLINQLVNEEVRHWADRLGVTMVQLKSAINIVGPLVADVRDYLEKIKQQPGI